MKRRESRWEQPIGKEPVPLYLYNSLTRRKEKFIPKNSIVTWYSCGPTTYDSSHMGHARSYISFDILRRVLQDYFGYHLFYVMNVTDIDDKIIKRARTKYLFNQYKENMPSENDLLDDISKAFLHHEQRISTTEDVDKRNMLVSEIKKVKEAVDQLKAAKGESEPKYVKDAMEHLTTNAEPVLGEWLDANKGHLVTDNSIFTLLPRQYEEEFNKDMEDLNVLPPDVVTRVSEFIPEIVKFVTKVIANEFAYESNGSVYFDVAKFDSNPDHYYAKLVPEAYGNQGALAEGEGTLSQDRSSEKKNLNDFALWKSSKPGEPWWNSPWGKGRPGWHIECSAMAAETIGENLDIHTGGVDLKFPHHDNEMSQSEAYFGCNQWVNYFLHTGHLHIDGCKMSKSLKNFVTIKDALKEYSTSQLRMAFLLHSWKDTLDYSANTMEGAKQYLKMVTEFSLNVGDIIRRHGVCTTLWTEAEKKLNLSFNNSRLNVHKFLCDNIDTKSSLDIVRDLITETNKYMSLSPKVNSQLLTNIKNYVSHLLKIYGVPLRESEGNSQDDGKVLSLAGVVGEIREKLRSLAKGKEADASLVQKNLLSLCDQIRDEMLPPLGVRLEDRDQGAPSIKLVNAKELLKELSEKKKLEDTKKAEKERKKAEAALKKASAQQEVVKDPEQMFRTDEYSAWAENGLPTHDKEGKEISKSQVKKLTKMMEAQKKKYDKWKTQQSA